MEVLVGDLICRPDGREEAVNIRFVGCSDIKIAVIGGNLPVAWSFEYVILDSGDESFKVSAMPAWLKAKKEIGDVPN